MDRVRHLSPAELCRRCDPAALPFESTTELPDLLEVAGQERAVEAIRFGIDIRRYGYNLYALGPTGMAKHTFVRQFLEQKATEAATPPDWCYVHNFADPDKPRALQLPCGRGIELRRDVERLIEDLRAAIPAAFDSDDYRRRRKLLETQFGEESDRAFTNLEKNARQEGIAVIRTPVGVALAPLRGDDVMDPEEFSTLPQQRQEQLRAQMSRLQEQLQEALSVLPREARRRRTALKALDREVSAFAAHHLIDEVRAHYAALPAVLEHLNALEQDILENAEEFQGRKEDPLSVLVAQRLGGRFFQRYAVNVLVDRSGLRGAPVVYEDHPTLASLVGRIEHFAEFGSQLTDFRLIRAGALHRANGGYLILDARKILQQPFAWDELKRALRSRLIRIELLGQSLGLTTTVAMEPEPIPLDVKVVLVGERFLYYLLAELDPEFLELFKVSADFEDDLDRSPEGELQYARLIGTLARKEGLRPLDRTAVARFVEHGARLAGDAYKLSVRVESLVDLLQESDHVAGQAGKERVTAADVQQAIDAQVRRASRLRDRVQEEIRRGNILIDTRAERVGQVNGLSVVQLGGFAFGRPSRITALVRLGSGKVVDIEREVELGGPIHSKGVMILAGYLGARYAAEKPFALQASLVFEQSYSGVEGDSASCAELFALLSSLAGLPVKQSLAVTGSVNQQGQVQAVGGVNEKIEGFFDVCKSSGLTGAEGVVIPAANVKHLMLRDDVVDAAAKGLFHVFPIETADQGIEILTGVAAGERDAEGRFPEGTVNHRVEARVASLAEAARAFAQAAPAERT